MTAAEVLTHDPAPERTQRRVLFIMYGLQPAGPELRLLEFARHFPASTEVHIIVIDDDLTLLDEFRKTNAKVAIIRVRRPWTEWGQLRKVLDYIRTHDIEIVNSFDLKSLLVALAAKLRFGRRVKLVHHLISLWDDLRDHHRHLIWGALRYADVVVCNGHAVRERLIGSRRMRARVVTVPNGVDCKYFRPSAALRRAERERLGFSDDELVLGTVANVRPVKNYPLLLNTLRRLVDRFSNVRLVCVGGGPQQAEMRQLAQQLGVGDRVLFTGQAKDVKPWLATFDAFALCSFKEGCPNALMQAMAMGLSSMSSAVGEVPHLTDGERCGLLFDPTDADACFAAAVRLMHDAELRAQLGAAGRRRMEEHYSNERMISDYLALYEATGAEARV